MFSKQTQYYKIPAFKKVEKHIIKRNLARSYLETVKLPSY